MQTKAASKWQDRNKRPTKWIFEFLSIGREAESRWDGRYRGCRAYALSPYATGHRDTINAHCFCCPRSSRRETDGNQFTYLIRFGIKKGIKGRQSADRVIHVAKLRLLIFIWQLLLRECEYACAPAWTFHKNSLTRRIIQKNICLSNAFIMRVCYVLTTQTQREFARARAQASSIINLNKSTHHRQS